mmetsp:Transcript_49285/g.96409  ORF Transcript_49285/g.96409 Transcript_49285/m.96409 type:complete len:711 (+) Transcript_49285:103-2235(+)|eukprot:CAMPEP_0194338230 /NCGR_PEP_ID=MMETSP0171-20130528/78859_1 /TAXON_ID=218684 /ORGANISM="Corethron pennatum, Strain L29A3" /LENGTH=710 /DNA_ID=CAMNT_0039102291 /DNA_START=12 /DNA_END=2144 /DNA_ORIENTATION=+
MDLSQSTNEDEFDDGDRRMSLDSEEDGECDDRSSSGSSDTETLSRGSTGASSDESDGVDEGDDGQDASVSEPREENEDHEISSAKRNSESKERKTPALRLRLSLGSGGTGRIADVSANPAPAEVGSEDEAVVAEVDALDGYCEDGGSQIENKEGGMGEVGAATEPNADTDVNTDKEANVDAEVCIDVDTNIASEGEDTVNKGEDSTGGKVMVKDDSDHKSIPENVSGSTPKKKKKTKSSHSSHPLPHSSSRIPLESSSLVRMSPIYSPGLIHSSGGETPAVLFDKVVASAYAHYPDGVEPKHRGSSVRWKVGDMFDSRVDVYGGGKKAMLALGLWNEAEYSDRTDEITIATKKKYKKSSVNLQTFLEKALNRLKNDRPTCEVYKPAQFVDMIPKSCVINCPEEFLDKQKLYFHEVKKRENAIAQSQKEAEAYADAMDTYKNKRHKIEESDGSKENIELPPKPPALSIPIPRAPTPPPAPEILGNKKNLVGHLDPECFRHLTSRYYGLTSNNITDPQFVGPNAPGLTGPAANQSLQAGQVVLASQKGRSSSGRSGGRGKNSSKKDTSGSSAVQFLSASTNSRNSALASSSSDLKRVMEEGGENSEKMRFSLLKAAIIAIESGQDGGSWVAYNGEVYPDVSKAFGAYSGVKPCTRCKSNKQGAFYCRFKRCHRENDYDGGDSIAILDNFKETFTSLDTNDGNCSITGEPSSL